MIKCDFCGCEFEATRAHTIHCEPVAVPCIVGDDVIGGWFSPDDWAACEVCYGRLLTRNFRAIVADVLCGLPESSPEYQAIGSMLESLYSSMAVLQ